VRRLFWVALGLGAGAVCAILASRFVRKQTAKVAPANLAREARGGMMDLARLVSDSLAEGKAAMHQKEDELRSGLR
jgi:sensor histidine kinase regulating citrate/malate metabolism